MKKVLVFALASLLVSISSCKKERFQTKEEPWDPSIVKTVAPPKQLWGPTEIYGSSNLGLLTNTELGETELKGYRCMYWYDQNGQAQSYYCDDYYLIPVYKNYGSIGAITYISPVRELASIRGRDLLKAQEIIKRKKRAIVDIAWGYGNNPINSQVTIGGVHD